MQPPKRPLSDYEVDEKAASAHAILQDPLISEALKNLEVNFVEALIKAPIGGPDAMTAQAGLKVVQGFRDELQAMVTEKKMREHRNRSGS